MNHSHYSTSWVIREGNEHRTHIATGFRQENAADLSFSLFISSQTKQVLKQRKISSHIKGSFEVFSEPTWSKQKSVAHIYLSINIWVGIVEDHVIKTNGVDDKG
ncbi:hypothetical protein NPIL_84561 [Nephila pilipes]|uniref:Uncharacterized protein n=1 Tax=Nephila pilipes TaxID=299642 RepID=A0A8X6TIC1_NEPPI|nr:hypothetical protein NPIL_84561 [Nephila pilipes]